MGNSTKRRKKKSLQSKKSSSKPSYAPLQQAIEHHQSGRLQEAEKIYRLILENEPDHADANHLLGVLAYQVGQYDIANSLISKALEIDSRQPLFHLNLGNVLQDQRRADEAVTSYRKALAINPDFPEAHNNMGNALSTLGRADEAITCFSKALEIRPDYTQAHNNLGNSLKDIEQYDDAISHLKKAININSAYAEAHFNLGRAYFSNGQTQEAIESCRQAIVLKPDFVDAYINLGIILHKNGNLQDCLDIYRKVGAIAPDNPATHHGLANVMRDLGSLAEAITSYRRAIELSPDDAEVWENLQQTIKTFLYSKGRDDCARIASFEDFSPTVQSSYHFAMLEYYLESFLPHKAEASFKAGLERLPDRTFVEIERTSSKISSPQLFDQTIALLHFGRSGTGLMHSLMDNHPEISTLPSIYLSGYLNAGIWEELATGPQERLPERFADKFAVLFDADSPKPVPGTQKDGIFNAGIKEGTTAVGNNRNEVLRVDRDLFCDHARNLIARYVRIDAGIFLQIIHHAYEYALGRANKKNMFYHIHNPNMFAKFNLLRHFPDVRLMMMIREPVQSCESWLRRAFENDEYTSMTYRIITMLYDLDQVAFRRQKSVGVRMEDLKSRPKETMRALCQWLGIEESPTLYEMTTQGKKWWGDPSSPDYDDKKEMSPFDDTCIIRPKGQIFSERDRFLFETLFYPFSVHFGYRDANPDDFKRNLQEARGMLGNLLGFEQAYIDRVGVNATQLQNRNNYLMLRAALADRIDVLDEFGTYPHMLTPLTL